MKLAFRALALCALFLTFVTSTHAQSSSPDYRILDSLTLGGEGGWDYLTVDTAAHRLYVSRGTHVQVVDLKALKIIGDIPNTPGVHGVALDPGLHKGFTSNGRDSSLTVFDMPSLRTLSTLHIDARNPDAILFEPVSGRLFTFNGGSHNTTAFDPETGKQAGAIALGGKPEFAVSDGNGRIYVNIEDKSSLAVLDPKAMTIVAQWSLAPGEEPSGLALDSKNGRLFSVCSNRMMVISDLHAGKVIAHVPIGSGVDGAGFDAKSGCAFASNGEGTLTVVRQNASGGYEVAQTLETRRGARTMVVDPSTGKIYTVSAKFGPAPAPTAERPRPRPVMEPGTATLYVIGR